MALTTAEYNSLKSLATREGGMEVLLDEYRQMLSNDTLNQVVVNLGNGFALTVSDWLKVQNGLNTPVPLPLLPKVKAYLAQSLNTSDAALLFRALVAYYCATKDSFS